MIRCATVLLLASLLAAPAAAAEMPPNMTTYFFGVLMKGPKWSAEATPERTKIQEGHMAHLTAMWKAGRLVVKMHPWMVEGGILPDPLDEKAKAPGAK